MFSSDFSEDQLRLKIGHMSNTPTLVGVSFEFDATGIQTNLLLIY